VDAAGQRGGGFLVAFHHLAALEASVQVVLDLFFLFQVQGI